MSKEATSSCNAKNVFIISPSKNTDSKDTGKMDKNETKAQQKKLGSG